MAQLWLNLLCTPHSHLHAHLHSLSLSQTKTGGTFEMAQLWLNLPASAKMTPPRYQPITRAQIPQARFDNGFAELNWLIIDSLWTGAHPGPAARARYQPIIRPLILAG